MCKKGFGLLESLIGVTVFMVIAISVYGIFARLLEGTNYSESKISAVALASEQIEIIRNLPYSDVGLVSGIPPGKVQPTLNVARSGDNFTVRATIRNIDDPFDGTLGGTPNDLSPADYKLVQIDITCETCKNFSPLYFVTQVAPKSLETASTNGALFVRVFDANGIPVSGANVHIENNSASPAIVIDDSTNNDGMLQIVDAPPGVNAYEISVTKSGYTSERTYAPGAPSNPNPTKPHATVDVQQVTQLSFTIDRASTMNASSLTETCSPVPSIDFSMSGTKLIGTSPDILKYSANHVTDSQGRKTISNLEWDTYNLNFVDTLYDLAGSIPLSPIIIDPGATQDIKFVVSAKNPSSLLVSVKDAVTGLQLSDASARLYKSGYDNTLITNRGFIKQTDWSGGPGQDIFTDQSMYFDSDGNVSDSNPAGELKLEQIFGAYQTSGILTSSTFDIGSPGNFHTIEWQPASQPPDTGALSARFQIATNNDSATWNFIGPDGTPGTYYTVSNSNINPVHNNSQYLRYKVFLRTASTTWTPNISDAYITFTSSCVPPGQVFFTGLSNGDYTIDVSRPGYQNYSSTVDINSSWQSHEATLTP
ncbi:hypothetical protein A2Z63_02720 [Candidatus Giovannonibacteria bacterium RIFCSPLOWO2_02_44_8]|uniref:Carboxypeptidase regulatory-like domain-containing protein n=2 Tax=Candidatus Giovannoniibacteriota TaxID=1752738 RepID=A0A1F5XC53_9BACT|nr:MAG: hypothetical protein A2W57_03345 [Candidatus Giovannonibacteria bacterium RIFCSPHIGHO2_02_43_16]OGF85436.1 MAG: hypothetical protein A2Z63_02720 [Candidatus Giovannonibacteria bacterium RIFCSPLOWO2_02_44_8]